MRASSTFSWGSGHEQTMVAVILFEFLFRLSQQSEHLAFSCFCKSCQVILVRRQLLDVWPAKHVCFLYLDILHAMRTLVIPSAPCRFQ